MDVSMNTKQVIVMRKDLNMRKGKMIAQGSHASMAFLLNAGDLIFNEDVDPESFYILKDGQDYANMQSSFKEMFKNWITTGQTKICVQVNSEAELDEIFNKAEEAGLTVHMITDSGRTEFNGIPTKTCLAIGPNEVSKIDKITGHLNLL